MQNQEPEVKSISVELIDENPDQSRHDYDQTSLDELADSIARVGLLNPITVSISGNRFLLVAGHRRLRAIKLLRLDFIRATISQVNQTTQLAIMAHENLYRTDLSPLEEADFYQRLMTDQKLSIIQLIHLTGKPESYIKARLDLLTVSTELQGLVHAGKIPISSALELGRFKTPELIEQYTKYAVSTGASLATIRYWRQQSESTADIPATDQGPPRPLLQPGQQTKFGWNCFICNNFKEAQDSMTIHLCKLCFAELEVAKQNRQ